MSSDDPDDDWEGITFPVSTAGLFRQPLRQTLLALAETVGPDELPDRYGTGEVIEGFEQHVADLLGKPAAVFAPSGTMLQQIALRIWSERTGRPTVGMHPRSHLERHEFLAHQVLHGLRTVHLGELDRPVTPAVLDEVHEPLGTLLLELPQRELGYLLPTWEELQAMVLWARERDAVVHLDGARLWESVPFYADHVGAPPVGLAGVTDLFDTVYVSFYKILGGIAGSALAGPQEVVDEARVWIRRHGGQLISQWPMVVAARAGLERVLPRVTAYHERAIELADALAAIEGVEAHPRPPHVNAFRVYLHGDRDAWTQAHREVARETGLGLVREFHPTIVPSVSVFEAVVSEPSFDVPVEQVAEVVRAIAERVAR